MALKIGIVGLPNVGKSTLFNALTRSLGAEAANYPFCTIDPNVGIVEVPDARLQALAEIVKPARIIPASIEFVDIAGLVKGAAQGEGLGNKFLGAIREVDAICHVVRVFESSDITHIEGTIEPERDRGIIETELMLADLESVTKRLDKIASGVRAGDKEKMKEQKILQQAKDALEAGILLTTLQLEPEDTEILTSFQLLTSKPVIFAANVAEDKLGTLDPLAVRASLQLHANEPLVLVSAKIEAELLGLSPADAQEFLDDLGITSSGLADLVAAAYDLLGYQTYFTAGVQEVRAWTILKGSTAPQAAGVIHTDFEKGFIKADTIAFNDYIAGKGEAGAKAAGKLRIEGKEYIVKDGDVLHFKFNV